MSKHTPGPWCAMSNAVYSDDTAVCMITSYRDMTPRQTANARLIAAAPDLLAALWGMVTSFHAVEWMEPHMRESADKARAAIAKATGEA
jgi:hypothetical protein